MTDIMVTESASSYDDPDNTYMVYHEGRWYAKKDSISTLLIMGIDTIGPAVKSESYNNASQADFILLVILDQKYKSCALLHLNRDTMTRINVIGLKGEPAGTITGQLALAHSYGDGMQDSCINTADAVSDLLYGTRIDNYCSITMDAVAILNDMAGGVEVEVTDDFSGIDETLVQGETVLLKGEHALTYVRTRKGMSDSSNLTRMIRQRQYLSVLCDRLRLLAQSDDTAVLRALDSISEYMVADNDISTLIRNAQQFMAYDYKGFLSVKGEAVKGDEFIEFYPDEAALKDLVLSLFYTPMENE